METNGVASAGTITSAGQPLVFQRTSREIQLAAKLYWYAATRANPMTRTIIPILLLAFQLGAIVYARFVPTRYFCWAPFDTQTDYVASAVVNGKTLTPAEFQHRYRRGMRGFDNRSPQHVIDMLQQAEEKNAALGDKTTIVMKYRVNGKEPREWDWPSSQARQ